MITKAQIQRHARQAGQSLVYFETEVILTYLMQMLLDRGLGQILAFKGGTFLRKMVFGPGGRLSTDLDFTSREITDPEEMLLQLMIAMEEPYLGLSFRYEKDKDLYVTEDGCSANPVVSHADNPAGVKIKIQVSMREHPTLKVDDCPHITQPYFKDLEFAPAAFPCLAKEEVIAEKVRAGQQRAKIRDLWDLSELSSHAFNRALVRSLAVIKVWQANNGAGFDHQAFAAKIRQKDAYDETDLRPLLRKDKAKIDIAGMIDRVQRDYAFLNQLSADEIALASDVAKRETALRDKLCAQCVALSERR